MAETIVASDARKRYGETTALTGVSLSVERGEVFALVGPNGAGKTTLVRALTGTTDLDGGEVALLGAGPGDVRRNRIGLLPQAFEPPARLTARELVAHYAGLYADHRDPDAVLADVGLADTADARYEALSGGQQRRVCVGTALVNDPEVVFLDEPTTGIDPAGRRAVWGLIEDLAAGGSTVLLTTHDMAEAERLADRVGLLADGDLVAVGSPEDLVATHGGRPRLEVRTGEPAADGADRLRDALDLAGDDVAVAARGDQLVVHGLEPTEIGDVAATLADLGLAYDSLTWREPDLEDVYLELTGNSYEGGGQPGRDPVATPAGGDS